MGYKDPDKQRAYQRAWFKRRYMKRRREWLLEHGPCRVCGSWKRLDIDHIDPVLKIGHNIWSWSRERREAELDKCEVLCRSCHNTKTAGEHGRVAQHGKLSMYRKGCRCAMCREAVRVASARRYQEARQLLEGDGDMGPRGVATGDFAIKTRKLGDKQWQFVSGRGFISHLRVRATRFERERAVTASEILSRNNIDSEFRVVKLYSWGSAIIVTRGKGG